MFACRARARRQNPNFTKMTPHKSFIIPQHISKLLFVDFVYACMLCAYGHPQWFTDVLVYLVDSKYAFIFLTYKHIYKEKQYAVVVYDIYL